jgi:GDP-L-fucose synthase
MKVVVTGGTGFVGKRLKKIKPEWTYLSSKDYDLVSTEESERMYQELQPDAVVHMAGKVGGIKANNVKPAEFYYLNTMINTNIVHQGYLHGVKRILASLSTCTFPDVVQQYPLTERDILSGSPAKTNLSYGYSKRSLYIQINSYRKQYGLDYSTFCPSNIYGPEDNFDYDSSHFVPALVRKFCEASDGDVLEFWGTGQALRQEIYVDDLAKIIPVLLEKHHSDVPVIVSPHENFSILEMINTLRDQLNKDVQIKFNNELDGQFRKDGSNKYLLNLIGEFGFTPFAEGVKRTYNWYKENRGPHGE